MSNVSKEIAIELVEDGQAGNGIVSVTRTYGISASGTTASDTTSPSDITTWSAGSPTVTTAKPYLWVKEITVYTEIPDTTKYYCVGKRGDNGVDAKDVEWAYIRTTTPTPPTILNDSTYTDSNSKTYTADGHLPRVDSTNRTDIEKENSGSSSKYYECTDDPKGVTDYWKYEWEIKRTKGNAGADGSRAWNYYGGTTTAENTMTLHNNYAESAFIIDIDNDNDQFGTDSDSKVLVEQVRTTRVTLYDGSAPQTLTSLTATLKYEDGTSVPTSVATKTTDATTGAVSVTVLQNNTANTHAEIQAHISATCAKGTKTIVFTLYKVMGGAPGLTPIIYQVAATNKVFSFARTSSNELTPSSESSNVTQINVARTEGNTTTILSTAQTGLTFSWGFDDDETPQASSQSIGDTIEVSASQATSHGRVWVLLSTGDRETLSIVKDGAKGASGDNGYNTATIFLYKRSETTISSIDWSNTLTYTFSSKSLNSVPTGWSLNTIPSGNDPLYVTAATAYSRTSTDTIASNEWSAPTKFVENGGQGEHGLNSASVFLYQRKSSAPTKPSSTLTYTFATGVLSGTLGDWSQTIPDTDENHLTCWVIQATAVSQGATDTIASTEWSAQKQLVQDGSNGNPGGNTATVFLYSRTKSTIDWTSTLTYTFSTQSLNSVPSGWSLNKIPSGTSPVYVTAATAYSTGETDTITYTEWASPVKFVENGATGGHGINTASLYLYQRAATMPNKPSSTLTYTFATGVISGTLGSWSQTIPATDSNHYPCWVIQATAIGTGDTDSISSSEWSEQQKLVEDGGQGDNGGNTATIYLYKRSSTAISTVGISSKLYYKFSTKKLYTNSTATTEATTQLNGWSLTIPSNSTDPIYVTAAIAYSNTEVDDIATSEWVTPAKFTENGVEGGHGINTAVVFIYKRASSQPSDKPTGKVTYTFASGDITLESGKSWNSWSTTIPSTNGNPCWVRQAVALGSGDTDDIETTDWSDVTKLVTDGATGLAGYNTATIFLYSRTNSTITWSNSLTYTFSTKSLSSVPSGWSLNAIPSGTDPIYVTAATATSRESTDSIDANEWATPVLFSENGDAGLNSATVFLYQRASSTPSKPSSSLTYTFSTGVLSGTLGNWSQSIPTVNGNPCWITQATAIATTSTDTIASSEWSTVSKLVEDGTSPIIVDLDNQADIVAVDSDGKVRFARTVTVKARIYNGDSTQTSGVSLPSQASSYMSSLAISGVSPVIYHTSVSDSNKITGTTTSVTGGVLFIVWTFAKNTQMSANTTWEKTIQLKYSNVTYDAAFSLTSSDTDAVYQLKPNKNELPFSVDANNTYTPSELRVKCGYIKDTGSGVTAYEWPSSPTAGKVDDKYYILYRRIDANGVPVPTFSGSQTEGWNWTYGTVSGERTGGEIIVSNASTNSAVEFCLSPKGAETTTNSDIIDIESIPIVRSGKAGTSPFIADLDNEMDSVACDSNGEAVAQSRLYTKISAFYGSTDVTNECTVQLTSNSTNGTVKLVSSSTDTGTGTTITSATSMSSSRYIRVEFASGQSVSQHGNVVLSIVHSSYGTRSLTFTVNGVCAGDNGTPATVFSLLPSVSAIKRDKNGNLTPTSPITCSVQKVTGSNTPTTATSSDGTLRYLVDGDITSSSQGTAWSSGASSVSVAYTSSNKYITFAFFKGSTMLDKERVPIVYDGEDGDNGDSPVSVFAWNISSTTAPTISGNSYPPTGWATSAPNRPDMAVVFRNNFTTSNWNTYGTVGHVENWSSTSSIRGSLTTGSWFVVFGKATDGAELYHTLLYQCDNTSGDLHGVCMAHYSSSTDNNEYFLWESQSWRHKSSNGTLSYDTWGSPFRVSGDTGQGGLSIAITPNTMAVNTDASGVTESASQDFSLKVYKGASEVAVSEYAISHSSLPDSDWTWTGLYYNAFRIQCASGATFTTPTAITVTVALSTGGSIQTSVLLVPNRKGADGASPYSIDLTNDMDAIQYADDVMAGSDVTTTAKLYCGTRELELTTDYTLSYSATGCTASRSGQVITVSSLSAERGYVVITATLVADNTKTFSAVFTVMRLQNKDKFYIQTDKQVIPINTDTTSSSTTFPINIKVYRDGINPQSKKVETSLVQTLSNYGLYLWAGSENPRSYVTTYSSGYTYNMAFSETNVHIYITDNETFGSGTILDHEVIPSVRVQNGQQGEKGDVARQPYEWGKWSDFISNDSNTFTANKYEAPFFIKEAEVTESVTSTKDVKRIAQQKWLWVGADGEFVPPGATTVSGQQNATTPSSSDENWELMITDFKYLISEAMFSNYAKLGSGIFNGDYAFSQYGRMDGATEDIAHYKNFRPEFFKGTPYTMLSSLKYIGTTYTETVPYEFGTIYLEYGVTYTIKIEIAASWSSYVHLAVVRVSNNGYLANWSSQGGSSGSTITKTFTPAASANSDEYAIRAWSTSGGLTFRKITISANKAFKPNIYIDWLKGEIYSQLGRFVNITVEGVINNLIHELTSANYTNWFYSFTSGKAWLDPLQCGTILWLNNSFFTGNLENSCRVMLPCACSSGKIGKHSYSKGYGDLTLDEIRQCVGKKIYILHEKDNVTLTYECAVSGVSMLVYKNYDWENLSNLSTSSDYIIHNDTSSYVRRCYNGEYQRNSSSGNKFTMLECKMGIYNNTECIYWEVTMAANTLDYYLG